MSYPPRPCPFCRATVHGPLCAQCGQDPSAARMVCKRCQQPTPSAVKQCIRCGLVRGSEMAWKIPVIVLMFVAAFILAVALQFVR